MLKRFNFKKIINNFNDNRLSILTYHKKVEGYILFLKRKIFLIFF